MGIIKAAISTIGGSLADQWKEVLEADSMDSNTLMAPGVTVRADDKRNTNRKGTEDYITDGSVIHVGEKQFMIMTSGGKIVDYSAEPGYYVVKTGTAPSLFNGQFKDTLSEALSRFGYGGVTPSKMEVFFLNMSEVRDIPFGTQSPLNYFDSFYNAELYLRANGYFSVRISNPLLFYGEVGARASEGRFTSQELQRSFLAEFLGALQTSIAKLSVEGVQISHVSAKNTELSKLMSDALDEEWSNRRGVEVETVGINAITYDDASKELINIRNRGAMLQDASIREGYVQGSVARGIESAGSNTGGAGAAFMGVNMGMQGGGGFMGAASASNQISMQQQAAQQPAAPQAEEAWKCPQCEKDATGNFCASCGQKKPEAPPPAPQAAFCPNCGTQNTGEANFCPKCGNKLA